MLLQLGMRLFAFYFPDKSVYIYIRKGLKVNGKIRYVCKLKKAIYGLKQGPYRQQNRKFIPFLKRFGFRICSSESLVFICVRNGRVIYIALFVDDGMIFAQWIENANEVISALKKCFEAQVGEADIFVGIQISRSRKKRSIFLHQQAYTNKFLKRFSVVDGPTSVPADPNTILCKPKQRVILNVSYREVIGSLMFLSYVTHPDLTYIVLFLSRYDCNYYKSHWRALQRVLEYLKQTSKIGMKYEASKRVSYSKSIFRR